MHYAQECSLQLEDERRRRMTAEKELEKKLNVRKGTEDPYGINTPSSKKVNKPNSTTENRAKRGGAKPGHKGSGRKDFLPENEPGKHKLPREVLPTKLIIRKSTGPVKKV